MGTGSGADVAKERRLEMAINTFLKGADESTLSDTLSKLGYSQPVNEGNILSYLGSLDEELRSEVVAKLGLASDIPHTLKLANNRPVKFYLHTVAAKDLHDESIIFVAEDNPRNQENLSAIDVSDILETIDEKDIIYPAYGFKNKDGAIEIIDGSRRFYSAKLKNIDYPIYVTDEILDLEDVHEFDRVDGATLARTCVENGQYWLQLQKKLGIETIKELADYLNRPYQTVNSAVTTASVKDSVMKLCFSPSRIGRTLVKKLDAAVAQLNETQFAQVSAHHAEFIKQNYSALKEMDSTTANKKTVNSVVQFIKSKFEETPPPSEKSTLGKWTIEGKNCSAVVSKSIAEDGVTGSISLTLTDIPASHRDKLIAEFEALTKRHMDAASQ